MARYRRSYRPRRSNDHNMSWFPINYWKAQSYTSGKTYLIATSEARDYDQVCERQRGIIRAPQTSSSNFEGGVLFSVVLPDIIAGNTQVGDEVPANFPDALDGEGTDDFPLWHPFDTANGYTLSFDSKAKRKVNKDDLLYTCLRIGAGGTASLNIGVFGRCLFKWKI